MKYKIVHDNPKYKDNKPWDIDNISTKLVTRCQIFEIEDDKDIFLGIITKRLMAMFAIDFVEYCLDHYAASQTDQIFRDAITAARKYFDEEISYNDIVGYANAARDFLDKLMSEVDAANNLLPEGEKISYGFYKEEAVMWAAGMVVDMDNGNNDDFEQDMRSVGVNVSCAAGDVKKSLQMVEYARQGNHIINFLKNNNWMFYI